MQWSMKSSLGRPMVTSTPSFECLVPNCKTSRKGRRQTQYIRIRLELEGERRVALAARSNGRMPNAVHCSAQSCTLC
jgi:hypothetical protein